MPKEYHETTFIVTISQEASLEGSDGYIFTDNPPHVSEQFLLDILRQRMASEPLKKRQTGISIELINVKEVTLETRNDIRENNGRN